LAISVFDLFKIGIGPSSSHTVGPMVASRLFAQSLVSSDCLSQVHRLKVELFGSLGATGKGHGSDKAVLLGLEGETPKDVDVAAIEQRLHSMRERQSIALIGQHTIAFTESRDLILHKKKALPFHPNRAR